MGLWLDRGRECDNLHQAIEIQIIHYLCGTDSPVSVALNTPLDRPIDRALRGFFIRFCYPSVTRPPKWRLLVTNKPIYHSELQPILERSNRFCIGKYGEQNIAAFIVHLDELNPHVHCTLLPIKDGRFAYKEIFAGKDKFEYSARMKQLHTDFFAEVNTRWGMSRGTSISETGARHRTTEEYRRMLSEECTTIEENIDRHQKVLATLQSDIRLAERRVKGLTTMVDNLEKSKAEKEALLSAAEQDLKANKGDAEQLAAQVKSLEKELAGINRQLADKQEKLQTADRQLAELKENMDAIEERTGELKEEAYKYSHDIHSKVDTLLKDVLLENVVGEYRNVSAQMDVAERQLFDGSLVQSIAEQGTDVMHCATMLFLGMVDDATTFAETRGGGGGGSDLKWGRDEDEDNRAWALRSMRMASRMMRPAIGKKPKR